MRFSAGSPEPRLSPGCTRSFPSRFQEAAAAPARPPPVAPLAGAADDLELVVRWEGGAVGDGAVELNGDDRVAEDLPGRRVEGSAVLLCSAEGYGAGGVHVEVDRADGLVDQVAAVGPVFAEVEGYGEEFVDGAVGVGDHVALFGDGEGEGAAEDAGAGLGVGRRPDDR